jgi:hypothetical protein
MLRGMSRKGFVLGIIVLFFGISVLPSISGDILGFNNFQKKDDEQSSFELESLEFGDIIFMDVKPIIAKLFNVHGNKGFSNDHCAFYIGYNWFIEASDYSMSKLNLFDGVQFTPMWFYRCWAHNFSYGRVINASSSQKSQAFIFHLKQFREPYQYGWLGFDDYMSWHSNPDIDDPNSPYYYPDDTYLNYWYCSEIIWASYLHQNINLDATPDPIWDPYENGYYYLASVNDLRNSENVTMFQEI